MPTKTREELISETKRQLSEIDDRIAKLYVDLDRADANNPAGAHTIRREIDKLVTDKKTKEDFLRKCL